MTSREIPGLYPQPPWLYWDVEAVIALASFASESIKPLLPSGVEAPGDTVLGAVWIARYPRSTLGPYNEALIALQVIAGGEPRYYIPFIYVDNDSALAAGREVAGAPKKYARITIEWAGRSLVALAERAGMRITLEVSPEYVVDEAALTALLSREGTPLLSKRVIPSVPEGEGFEELIAWKARVWMHRAMDGVKAWGGPARIMLESGVEDPVGDLVVAEVYEGFYAFFDMALEVEKSLGKVHRQ